MMESIKCTETDCNYATPDKMEATVVAALLNAHASQGREGWEDFKSATRLMGTECVIQLLECCEESLHKDLTRAAGGSLTCKSEADVLTTIKSLAVREENTMAESPYTICARIEMTR